MAKVYAPHQAHCEVVIMIKRGLQRGHPRGPPDTFARLGLWCKYWCLNQGTTSQRSLVFRPLAPLMENVASIQFRSQEEGGGGRN